MQDQSSTQNLSPRLSSLVGMVGPDTKPLASLPSDSPFMHTFAVPWSTSTIPPNTQLLVQKLERYMETEKELLMQLKRLVLHEGGELNTNSMASLSQQIALVAKQKSDTATILASSASMPMNISALANGGLPNTVPPLITPPLRSPSPVFSPTPQQAFPTLLTTTPPPSVSQNTSAPPSPTSSTSSASTRPFIPPINLTAESVTAAMENILTIEKCPSGSVPLNQHLPKTVIRVSKAMQVFIGSLQVQVWLIFSDNTDGSAHLQGSRMLPVEADGCVCFSKLRLVDLPARYYSSALQLQFQLFRSESAGHLISVGLPVRTPPFTVQRPPKRKRTSQGQYTENTVGITVRQHNDLGGSFVALPGTGGKGEAVGDNRAISPMPTRPAKRLHNLDEGSVAGESTNTSPQASSGVMENSIYVDITDLLSLPQKEAAAKLGISESMLCKRFKECTRRKWPYRYLRKIEKMINMLETQKRAGSLSKEDEEKLNALLEEREECLTPVKIRITNHDKQAASSPLSTSAPQLQTSQIFQIDSDTISPSPRSETTSIYSPRSVGGASSSDDNDDLSDDEVSETVVETLGKLRQSAMSPAPQGQGR